MLVLFHSRPLKFVLMRKEQAGMGLRLAVSNGMASDESGKGMRPSERTHRNRLFWTIYMQER